MKGRKDISVCLLQCSCMSSFQVKTTAMQEIKKSLEENCYLCLLIILLSPKSEVLYTNQLSALNIT